MEADIEVYKEVQKTLYGSIGGCAGSDRGLQQKRKDNTLDAYKETG